MVKCQHEEVHNTILDAAGRLLEQYGYRKMTVDDIAQEAGVGKGTIYLYFDSKSDVALSWISRSIRVLLNELKSTANSNMSPIDKLHSMLLDRVLLRFDIGIHFKQSFEELFAPVRAQLQEKIEQISIEEAGIFAQVIDDGCAQGILCSDNSFETAYSMVIATNSLLPISMSAGQLGERNDLRIKVNNIANLLLYGLITRKE